DTHGISRHPDQHAMAAIPSDPNILVTGDDGGLWRIDGTFTDISSQCSSRPISGNDLTDCLSWLSKGPTTISSLNPGLGTLQYQSISLNPQNPLNDLIGGTQDNGTHSFMKNGGTTSWFVSIFGDGGQSGIDKGNPQVRTHTFFGPQGDINF